MEVRLRYHYDPPLWEGGNDDVSDALVPHEHKAHFWATCMSLSCIKVPDSLFSMQYTMDDKKFVFGELIAQPPFSQIHIQVPCWLTGVSQLGVEVRDCGSQREITYILAVPSLDTLTRVTSVMVYTWQDGLFARKQVQPASNGKKRFVNAIRNVLGYFLS